MQRRTKIVSTLGPATTSETMLKKIIQAGTRVVRLNFSHGEAQDHIDRALTVRRVAKELETHVAILGDLQGPKLRISKFINEQALLIKDQIFALDANLNEKQGNEHEVGIDYKRLPQDVSAEDILLLDDGKIRLEVISVANGRIETRVINGGILKNNKGLNRLGGGLSAPALTEKDKRDILTAAKIQVDYLAISFPRSGDDLHYARQLALEAGFKPSIMAKIERAEAVASDEALDDIIQASDAVMVARGDLAVEIGDEYLVGKQKQIIARSRQLDKVVITATQMMESMITNPVPTRAEVMDVANAVFDGTDAVMLSAETATGEYPEQTVKEMAKVCRGAEEHPTLKTSKHRMELTFDDISQTIAQAAMYAANHHQNLKAIVALTESGRMALLLSRITSHLPIFALSRHDGTLNKMALYRGVYPIAFDSTQFTMSTLSQGIIDKLLDLKIVDHNDVILLTHGDVMEVVGQTNTCKLITVN